MNSHEKINQQRKEKRDEIKKEKEIKITLIVRQISLLEQILELLKNYFQPSTKKFEVLEEKEPDDQEKGSVEDLILDGDIMSDYE